MLDGDPSVSTFMLDLRVLITVLLENGDRACRSEGDDLTGIASTKCAQVPEPMICFKRVIAVDGKPSAEIEDEIA